MSFSYFDWIAHYADVRGDKTALGGLRNPVQKSRILHLKFGPAIPMG